MPLPSPNRGESQDDFIGRCMSSDAMQDEFPEQKQRAAVCHSQWKDKASAHLITNEDYAAMPNPRGLSLDELFRHVQQPRDELEQLQGREPKRLQRVIRMYARIQITNPSALSVAFDSLFRAIWQGLSISDLLGRRRALLEVRAAENPPKDVRERVLFTRRLEVWGTTLVFANFAQPVAQLPQVPFEEAIADIIRREPVLASTAAEVAAVYQSGYGFAVARSTSLKVTERVQAALARAARQGRTLSEAEDILSAIGNWVSSYSETVYRTNLNTAYTAGRMEQAKDPVIREVMGAYERVAINDADVRRGRRIDNGANHLAASGLIASIDDRIWDTHATPSGYG